MLLSPSWTTSKESSEKKWRSNLQSRPGFPFRNELPVELWPRIFRHLEDVSSLGTCALVCKKWNREVVEKRGDHLWKAIWELRALGGLGPAWARLNLGGWRGEVSASRLLRSGKPRSIITLPMLANEEIDETEKLSKAPTISHHRLGFSFDFEGVLGDPVCVQVFGTGVCVIGFRNGIGVLRPSSDGATKFRYDVGRPFTMFGKQPLTDGRMLALTPTKHLYLINVEYLDRDGKSHEGARRGGTNLTYHAVDIFDSGDSEVTQLIASKDGSLALLGFMDGTLRVVDLRRRREARIFSMRESVDMLGCGEKVVAGANLLPPMTVTVWDIEKGRALHRFSQVSVGWEEMYGVSGIAVLHNDKHVIVWDGKHTLLIVDSCSGRVLRNISTNNGTVSYESFFRSSSTRCLSQSLFIACPDEQTVVAASATHIHTIVVDNTNRSGVVSVVKGVSYRQVALSMDGLGLIVTENAMSRIGKRAGSAASPCLKVLDRVSGRCTISLPVRGYVSSLSVAGSTIGIIDSSARYVQVISF